MTHEAATKITATITVATIQHMADTAAVSFNQVVELLISGHVNTVRRFNEFMAIAAKEARA